MILQIINIPMEVHMQNKQFHQEPTTVYDQKQHSQIHLCKEFITLVPSPCLVQSIVFPHKHGAKKRNGRRNE